MPNVLSYQINKSTTLGIWKLIEDVCFFENEPRLQHLIIQDYKNIKLEKRKKEWLGSRLLVSTLLNETVTISYTDSGKPYILNNDSGISISHCSDHIATLISDKKNIGVDIEKISPRIEKIVHKFLSVSEQTNIDPHQRLQHLYLHWCAKEAIVKAFDNKFFEFASDIQVNPFVPSTDGNFVATVVNGNMRFEQTLSYMLTNDFVVVWTL